MKTITNKLLSTVTGGATVKGPLSGDNNQNIQTNWGGTQTNIGTQIINEPPKTTNSVVDFMRNNPAARIEQMRRLSTPVGRGR
jgi:hypothetical protein